MRNLKTLVTGKAKTPTAEFAYYGPMYKDFLKSFEWKFSQSQAVVSAYLDKLSNFPPFEVHHIESMISSSVTISALVEAFGHCTIIKLSTASLLGQALKKLQSKLKEAWSIHSVKKNWDRQTLLEFNDCLKDKSRSTRQK